MPTPPRPTSSTGPRSARAPRCFSGAVSGQAGAHQRAGERRRKRCVIDQIARMRDEHVAGKAAVGGDAEMMMVGAQVLLAGTAGRAGAAADPGIDRDAVADHRAFGIRSCAFDHAGDLMAERERQRAILGDVEPLVVAEREIAVLQMQVGMAHAAAFDAHQHFAAARRRTIDDGLAERLPVSDQRLAMHFRHRRFRSSRGRHHAS